MNSPDWQQKITGIWSKCETGETKKLVQLWSQAPRNINPICPTFDDFLLTYGLQPSLKHVFLSEYITPSTLQILMSGGQLDDLLGQDLTGENLYLKMPAHISNQERPYYNSLRTQPCAGRVIRYGDHSTGAEITYATIQLPLADLKGKIRFIVGTGQYLAPYPPDATSGLAIFESTKHVDLTYFDIGAGLPEQAIEQRQTYN